VPFGERRAQWESSADPSQPTDAGTAAWKEGERERRGQRPLSSQHSAHTQTEGAADN